MYVIISTSLSFTAALSSVFPAGGAVLVHVEQRAGVVVREGRPPGDHRAASLRPRVVPRPRLQGTRRARAQELPAGAGRLPHHAL